MWEHVSDIVTVRRTVIRNPVDSISDIARYTNRTSDSRNWSVSASYTEPVFKNHFVQLRYEFAHRKQLAQSLVYDSINKYPYPEYFERGK